MTVLIKYPSQSKERNKVFFEKQELINFDGPTWGGWWDTDGSFSNYVDKKHFMNKIAKLALKDRQPVELFSKTFETSLTYSEWKTTTPEPYKYEYIAKEYGGRLGAEKAVWFTKKIYPYLIKQEKKDYAAKLLGYRPESKDFADWTPDEVIHYLATAIEGDGFVRCRSSKTTKYIEIILHSSDVQYLSDIKYLAEKKLGIITRLWEDPRTYKTKEGIKTKYKLYIQGSRKNPNNIDFFKSLVKDGVMTLNRKKQKVQEFLGQAWGAK
jgi:hypothetical protein